MNVVRREWAWVVLLIGGMTLVSLWPLPVHMDRFLMPSRGEASDLAITHWPMLSLWRGSMRERGEWPLWMATYFSGQPLAGNPLAGFTYPPNWLHAALPTETAFAALALLHMGFGALGMYALMRKGAGLSQGGALLSAVVFSFGSRLAAHLGAGHVSIVYGWAWLPWVAWAAVAARSWRDGWRLGLALALAFLADVRMGYYAALVAGAIGVARGVRAVHELWAIRELPLRARHCISRGIGVWGAAALAFAGGAAVLAFPLLELLGQATRAGLSPQDAMALSLPPAGLLGVVLPLEPATHEWATYLGLPALGAAIVALWGPRRRVAWALWGCVALSAVLALGAYTPLYGAALRVLPGLSLLRVPARFWIPALGCVAALAGMGLDALPAIRRDARARRSATLGLGVLAAGAGALCGAALATGLGDAAAYLRFGIAGAVGVGSLALGMRGSADRVAAALLLCAAFVDATGAARAWWHLAAVDEVVAPGREVAAYLASLPERGRVYSPSYSVPQQTAWFYGLEMADGVDPTQLARYRRFMALAGGYEDTGYTVTIPPFPPDASVESALRDSRPNARLLGLLDITHIVAAFPIAGDGWEWVGRVGGAYIFRNTEALPRAWLVHEAEVVPEAEALGRLEGMDLRQRAVVAPEWAGAVAAAGGDADGDAVRVVARSANALELDVQASAPGLLLVSEVWYPGWRAWVDGRALPVARADYLLRAVPIEEAGAHRVRLAYVPVWLYVGAAVSAAAFLGYGIAAAWGGRR
ncbi:MAG: hypothetical protein Kow00123_19670 [Anaerolineales bacterium]